MILKGYLPLSKNTLQEYIQSFISKQWPQWKRERSLRKNDGEFNSYMESIDDLILEMETNNEFNKKLDNYKKSLQRLELPYDAAGDADAVERAKAQQIIDNTPEDVKTFEE